MLYKTFNCVFTGLTLFEPKFHLNIESIRRSQEMTYRAFLPSLYMSQIIIAYVVFLIILINVSISLKILTITCLNI